MKQEERTYSIKQEVRPWQKSSPTCRWSDTFLLTAIPRLTSGKMYETDIILKWGNMSALCLSTRGDYGGLNRVAVWCCSCSWEHTAGWRDRARNSLCSCVTCRRSRCPPTISLTGSLHINGFSAGIPPSIVLGWGTMWVCDWFPSIHFNQWWQQSHNGWLLSFITSADLASCCAPLMSHKEGKIWRFLWSKWSEVSHNYTMLSWCYQRGGEDGDEAIKRHEGGEEDLFVCIDLWGAVTH